MYDKRKFYWLKLKEDFFDDDAIKWLEEQPNGKEYSLFYLKLCLKSLKTNGILIRQVGSMLIPYDHIKLAELTGTNPDTALIALNLLIKIGLIQRLESGELFMTQLDNMVGSQTKGAFQKQQKRLEISTSGQMSANCPIDIEIEKDIEIDKEIDKKEVRHRYGPYGRILLTAAQYMALVEEYGSNYITEVIRKLDEYVQTNNNKNKYKDFNLVLRKAIREKWFKIDIPIKEVQPIVEELTEEEKAEAEELKKRLLG